MGLIRWFLEKTTERAIAITGALFTTRLETVAAIEEAECQDILEQRARQFEVDGKPQLAAALRAKATRITADAPGDSAIAAVQSLCKTDIAMERLLTAPPAEGGVPADKTEHAEPTAQRPVRCLPRRFANNTPRP
jgi:hypothetical protein